MHKTVPHRDTMSAISPLFSYQSTLYIPSIFSSDGPFAKLCRWISRGCDILTGLRTIFEVGMALDDLVVLEEKEDCSKPGLSRADKIGIVHGLYVWLT